MKLIIVAVFLFILEMDLPGIATTQFWLSPDSGIRLVHLFITYLLELIG